MSKHWKGSSMKRWTLGVRLLPAMISAAFPRDVYQKRSWIWSDLTNVLAITAWDRDDWKTTASKWSVSQSTFVPNRFVAEVSVPSEGGMEYLWNHSWISKKDFTAIVLIQKKGMLLLSALKTYSIVFENFDKFLRFIRSYTEKASFWLVSGKNVFFWISFLVFLSDV